jgi:flagellar biogenesis protein FliO
MTSGLRLGALAGSLLLPSAATAQRLGGAASADVSLVRIFLALLFCLILAGLAILLLRQRLAGGRLGVLPRLQSAGQRIRLVESRRISPQAEVSLVDVDGAEYLLLLSAGGPLLLKAPPAKKARGQG